MDSNMRDWSDLTPELLVEIATRTASLEDFMAFRGVCASWRAAVSTAHFNKLTNTRVPLFMIAEKEGSKDLEFYSMIKGKISMKVSVPESAKGRESLIETGFGWFLSFAEESGKVNFWNPFSRKQIQVPNFKSFPRYSNVGTQNGLSIKKGILSGNPASQPSDFVLMVLGEYLGFWKPGQNRWTRIEPGVRGFVDVNYYNGKFYAINTWDYRIWVWDESAPKLIARPLFSIERRLFGRTLWSGQSYLVKSTACELLLITRSRCRRQVSVSRLDVTEFSSKKMRSLGGDAVFLGHNAAVCVPVAAVVARPGFLVDARVKPNCIYSADEIKAYPSPTGSVSVADLNIYNLHDQSIEAYYILQDKRIEGFFNENNVVEALCPPAWVAPYF